jgi:hypothetical protein
VMAAPGGTGGAHGHLRRGRHESLVSMEER